jgi:hypothetical protein
MRPGSLLRRRPSAPLLISLLALFTALGGVGYAQFQVPPRSVGSDQLKTYAVTNPKLGDFSVGNAKLKPASVGPHKIMDGAIGKVQINANEVQARVGGSCAAAAGAISAIASDGTVQCVPFAVREFGATSQPVTVGSTVTQIEAEPLSVGSSHLVFAEPQATVTGGQSGQQVEVDCTLTVAPTAGVTPANSASVTGKAVVETGVNNHTLVETIPLVLAAPPAGTAPNATVSCSKSAIPATLAPTVSISSPINAIQTASNTTKPSTRAARK